MHFVMIRNLAFSLMLIMLGCASSELEQPVVKAVEDYCSIIQAVYISHDLNPMVQVATEKELKRVFPVVQALQAADNVMKTEIGEFKVKKTDVSPGGSAATVETAERWTYWWEDRKTGRVTKDRKTENYRLAYTLIKDKGMWKVDQIRNL